MQTFAIAAVTASVVSAVQTEKGWKQPSYNSYQAPYQSYGDASYYGGNSYQYAAPTSYQQPSYSYGQPAHYAHSHDQHAYHGPVKPTYGKKDSTWGVHDVAHHSVPKIGGDGYKVKPRSDPHYAPTRPLYAKCVLKDPNEESEVGGAISFFQEAGGKTSISGTVTGTTPGFHGFHIHALGDQRDGCASTGSHWNPDGTDHGSHEDHAHHRHAGDLAQVNIGYDGSGKVYQSDMQVDLWGNHSVIGRSLVLHAGEDDLGHGGDAGSHASGNSGKRIACCTIGIAGPPKSQY